MWKRKPEILLCPNIPKPMHGMAPRVVLGSKWWNKTRQEAYASCNYRCIACGVHKYRAKYREWLEAHEVYDIDYTLGRMTYVQAVPLCHFCHNFIHDGRMRMLVEQGKLSHGKYAAVLEHGHKILSEANLVKASYDERDLIVTDGILTGSFADWNDWRMVAFGVEYKPLFASYEEWLSYGKKEFDE